MKLARVIKVDYAANTVDVVFEISGGMIQQAIMVGSLASTLAGSWEMPLLNTTKANPGKVMNMGTGKTEARENLTAYENSVAGKLDMDDPLYNYAYAVVCPSDEDQGRNQWLCLGFVFPFRNQLLFHPEEIEKAPVSAVVKKAVKKMAGGLMHRTNSAVYWTVDVDGNMEWAHPNGSFFRIAEFPTQEEDGTVHVDFSKANRSGKQANTAWDTSKVKGQDGKVNSSRKVYGHVEIVTEKGTVQIDINKKTGDVTIRTPKNTADAAKGQNRVTIISGGDATIQSVKGDVTVQSAEGTVTVQAAKKVDVFTDSAAKGSVMLAHNAPNVDYLVLFNKLMQKFNNHNHTCTGSGKPTTPSNQKLDQGDATSVTKAG